MSVLTAMPLNDDTVSPGLLGFAVFLALAAATVLLVRSMNRQMKKIQAPREADLKQQEWERAQARKAGAEKAANADNAANIDGSGTASANGDDA
ncbi:hypothetical protein GCM10022254_05020 [Actinomadura meridiana]|uniref:Uncharacterized protein n=1 Tax=Actinomadura meridiana TaxID=559626 RepID=A0ABP8BSJ4_9ACTN